MLQFSSSKQVFKTVNHLLPQWPLSSTHQMTPAFRDPSLYRTIVGSLPHLTFTRLDISFVVHVACQHTQAPTDFHFLQVKRILRYIKGTIYYGHSITSVSDLTLTACSDSDWAGCSETRCSTAGYCIFLGNNSVSWSLKRQPTVSRSNTEAEYMAVAVTTA